MIVSRKHGFVFMHNPKVAGSSVRQVLDGWRDPEIELFDVDPDPASALHRIDRAHIGIAEFRSYYPDLWSQTKTLPFFVLTRDPLKRFLSSVNEYSRVYGEIDIRFADVPVRRRVLFGLIERLEKLGQTEKVLESLDLTHFRPQWIYLQPPEGERIELHAFDLSDMTRFTSELSSRIGAPLDFGRENSSEQFDLPGPMRKILANNAIKKRLRRLPGTTWAMKRLRGHGARTAQSTERLGMSGRYGLNADETNNVETFVRHFYARDYSVLGQIQTSDLRVKV